MHGREDEQQTMSWPPIAMRYNVAFIPGSAYHMIRSYTVKYDVAFIPGSAYRMIRSYTVKQLKLRQPLLYRTLCCC
jgi:hypothetical protein